MCNKEGSRGAQRCPPATSRPRPAGPIIERFDLSQKEGSQLERSSARRRGRHVSGFMHLSLE